MRLAPIWNVHVAGQILRTTAEHPFYVLGRGWIPTKMLGIGDLLLTRDGRLVRVEGAADSGTVETVYNFRVAEYHTYFVSATEDGISVWAHNAAYEATTFTTGRGKKAITRKVFKNMSDIEGGVPSKVDRESVHPIVLEKLDKGYTNKQLMQEGYAPIGRDGKPVNLHHLTGTEPGTMIELTQTFHQDNTRVLHNIIEDGRSFRHDAKLEAQFDRFKKKWWQERANDF